MSAVMLILRLSPLMGIASPTVGLERHVHKNIERDQYRFTVSPKANFAAGKDEPTHGATPSVPQIE